MLSSTVSISRIGCVVGVLWSGTESSMVVVSSIAACFSVSSNDVVGGLSMSAGEYGKLSVSDGDGAAEEHDSSSWLFDIAVAVESAFAGESIRDEAGSICSLVISSLSVDIPESMVVRMVGGTVDGSDIVGSAIAIGIKYEIKIQFLE